MKENHFDLDVCITHPENGQVLGYMRIRVDREEDSADNYEQACEAVMCALGGLYDEQEIP